MRECFFRGHCRRSFRTFHTSIEGDASLSGRFQSPQSFHLLGSTLTSSPLRTVLHSHYHFYLAFADHHLNTRNTLLHHSIGYHHTVFAFNFMQLPLRIYLTVWKAYDCQYFQRQAMGYLIQAEPPLYIKRAVSW